MIDTTFLAVGSLMLLSGYALMGRSNLVRMRQQATQAWAIIEPPLKQRDAALSELEVACRRRTPQELGALERVAAARSRVASAHQAFDPATLGLAEAELRSGLGELFAAAENLKGQAGDAEFRQLFARIVALEAKIAERGEVYNSAVNFHNRQIAQFPYLLLARPLGFTALDRLPSAGWKATDAGGSALL
ncbi:MAG: LemA family protein [Porticoccaceae bacterium]